MLLMKKSSIFVKSVKNQQKNPSFDETDFLMLMTPETLFSGKHV